MLWMKTQRRCWPTFDHLGFRHWPLAALAPSALGFVAACAPGSEGQPDIAVIRPAEPEPTEPMTMGMPSQVAPTELDVELLAAPPPPSCGDGALNDDEQCDDGGTEGNDG